MPKLEQQNIRVFHITYSQDEDLQGFLDKNTPLLSNFLLVFDNLSDEISAHLENLGLKYVVGLNLKNSTKANLDSIKLESNPAQNTPQKPQDSASENTKSSLAESTRVFKRPIRSGETIQNSGDIIVLDQVNSTAYIKSDKNICIFGECNGDVECDGEYMILSKITNGKVRFRGESISPNMLKHKLNLITQEDEKLNIKDILSLLNKKQIRG